MLRLNTDPHFEHLQYILCINFCLFNSFLVHFVFHVFVYVFVLFIDIVLLIFDCFYVWFDVCLFICLFCFIDICFVDIWFLFVYMSVSLLLFVLLIFICFYVLKLIFFNLEKELYLNVLYFTKITWYNTSSNLDYYIKCYSVSRWRPRYKIAVNFN